MSTVVWFVNTETGQEWAVSDPDMIDRLDSNKEFKRIDKTSKSKKAVKDAEEASAK